MSDNRSDQRKKKKKKDEKFWDEDPVTKIQIYKLVQKQPEITLFFLLQFPQL